MFEADFFGTHRESLAAWEQAIADTMQRMREALPQQAYAGGTPEELAATLRTAPPGTAPQPLATALQDLQGIIAGSIAVYHPHAAAHLHTPVLIPALAAEMILTALNQSMDSFDQAPAATLIELEMLDWLCRLVNLPTTAGGTFTAGGTQSNYFGLLLARDHFLQERWQWSARLHGLPPEAQRLRILCSELAHFSVEKSAIQLGLGMQAVVKVACDDAFRMRADDLQDKLTQLRAAGLEPMAIVATAGTTDFGSVDPLEAIADIAQAEKLWLHVDAAYGGALLLSPRLRDRLNGLSRADSVTMDFHKAFFQPISCGAFLLADEQRFDTICVHADYLNAEDREQAGIPDLATRSVLTTRRFDALKLWLSLRVLGLDRFAAMIERLHELACIAAAQIAAIPELELLHEPQFGCVVFRYRAADETTQGALNEAIPHQLFASGKAVLGHTKVQGRASLKLTLNNPCISANDIAALLEMITTCGRQYTERMLACHSAS